MSFHFTPNQDIIETWRVDDVMPSQLSSTYWEVDEFMNLYVEGSCPACVLLPDIDRLKISICDVRGRSEKTLYVVLYTDSGERWESMWTASPNLLKYISDRELKKKVLSRLL